MQSCLFNSIYTMYFCVYTQFYIAKNAYNFNIQTLFGKKCFIIRIGFHHAATIYSYAAHLLLPNRNPIASKTISKNIAITIGCSISTHKTIISTMPKTT